MESAVAAHTASPREIDDTRPSMMEAINRCMLTGCARLVPGLSLSSSINYSRKINNERKRSALEMIKSLGGEKKETEPDSNERNAKANELCLRKWQLAFFGWQGRNSLQQVKERDGFFPMSECVGIKSKRTESMEALRMLKRTWKETGLNK